MMDVEIAQTAETIKRQQGTLPEKTYKNPKDCNAVELRSGRHLPDPVPKKLTAKEKGKQKEEEQPEDVLDHETRRRTASCDRTTALTPQQGMIEEILADDSLEVALIRVESEQNTCNVDADDMDTRKIDDLAAKVDLLLKNNQNQIYVMEETNMELDQSGQPQRPISGKSVPKHWISEAIPSESESEWKDVHPQPSTESKEGEQSEDVLDDEQDAEHPAVIEPVALTMPDRPVPARVYSPKVPYPVPAKKSRKDWEEMKCKKMLEELNVKLSLMDAIQMILSMCNLNFTINDENAVLTPQ
ncbi:hypothetical protein DY000_02039688 [Brassica cretica]|uniref:Uncharacterized protein n=1 Tax=Brassica cretica TaxID=69181 RepID=A0ABQ7BD89_BRACR|nr:hypothetical protein DY000_02039688 [Brassica cretica]